MKRISLVGFFVGFAILTALVIWQGADVLSNTLNSAGLAVVGLPAIYLLPLICALLSWQWLFAPGKGPTLLFLIYATWINFSINWLLPVGQVGGEIARIRMMVNRRLPSSMAIATVIGDQTLQVVTQAIYALLGFVLFVAVQVDRGETNLQLVAVVFLGFVLFGIAGAGFYWLQHAGLFNLLLRIARKFPFFNSNAPIEEQAARLDEALKAMYQRGDRLFVATLWRFAFRITAAGETWLAFYLLGHPISWIDALILESMGQAIRSAAFVIPGGLGAQEGGFVVIGAALGIPGEVALLSSLCKRLRELCIGVPGLLVWQIREGQREWGKLS
ncbi:MAG: flippase-like domain-containing protein [Cyanobacteria bacterium J06633_2]